MRGAKRPSGQARGQALDGHEHGATLIADGRQRQHAAARRPRTTATPFAQLRRLCANRHRRQHPRLFDTVFVPEMVREELSHARAPSVVRDWIISRPRWLQVARTSPHEELLLPALDAGERAAIALAASLRANLMLIDDRSGVAAALGQGLAVVGTLGLLDLAARRGQVDLSAALMRLKATNFHYRQEMLDALPLCQRSCRPDRIGTFGGAGRRKWLDTDKRTKIG